MPPKDLAQAVLQFVRRPNYQPVKPKVIAKKLGLDKEGTQELKRVVKRLVKQGKLAYGASHRVQTPEQVEQSGGPPSQDGNQVTGAFRRTSSGYGFVRPSATPRSVGRKEDIYIAAKNAHDAASGDTVLVRLLRRKARAGRPGPEGEIIEIIERETNQFVGTYFERGGSGLVQVDGKVFTEPILVGDPGAKGAQPNDKVVLEMVRFPSHVHEGEGVITRVLGPRGQPGIDTQSIIYEFDLPGEFAGDALDAAREVAAGFDESMGEDRTDFTGETVITIDPEDARDFDDAISLKQLEGGHWQLGVHIADVSHFVRSKTPLDREARDRATSVYLPDMVIPMLPEVISNNLASLQPEKVRYTMSALLEITEEGVPVACDLHQGAIRSARRFTYQEVDDFLADRRAWEERLPADVHRLLGEMHTLAMTLRRRRFERGALELNMPEVKVELDRHGRVRGAHLEENTESHQIIEEFMLAANEAVARHLAERELPFIRRIHEPPDPRKLRSLTEFVEELGFRTESLESRFALQDLLNAVEGLPQEHAVNYAVLRSLQKAIYSPEPVGHYALASECYCHFTSPIRRYPDLTVHRLIKLLLAGKTPEQDLTELYAEAEHCSQREQRAEEAERELTKVKLLTYLSSRIGEEMDGIITGVEDFGLFVEAVEVPADGFIHISLLTDDYYKFDRATHTLEGRRSGNRYRLGDPVRVTVSHVDVDRRELDFRMVGRLGKIPKRKKKKKPRQRTSAPPKTASKKSTTRPAGKKTKKTKAKKKSAGKKTSTGKSTAKKKRPRK